MSKFNKKSTRQLDLFLHDGALQSALDEAASILSVKIRKSRLSREQILSRVNLILGRDTSMAQFNAWTAPTNRNRLPADVLICLLYILNNTEALNALLAPLNLRAADTHDCALADLGRVQIERNILVEKEREALFIIKGGKR